MPETVPKVTHWRDWPHRTKWYVGHRLMWTGFDNGVVSMPEYWWEAPLMAEPFVVSPPTYTRAPERYFTTYAEALAYLNRKAVPADA